MNRTVPLARGVLGGARPDAEKVAQRAYLDALTDWQQLPSAATGQALLRAAVDFYFPFNNDGRKAAAEIRRLAGKVKAELCAKAAA